MDQVIATSSWIVPPRRWGRSVAAVLLGLVAIVTTHTGADALLHAAGVYPPAGQVMRDGAKLLGSRASLSS